MTLQSVVQTAQYITGTELPAIQDLYIRRCKRTAFFYANIFGFVRQKMKPLEIYLEVTMVIFTRPNPSHRKNSKAQWASLKRSKVTTHYLIAVIQLSLLVIALITLT
jgi:hypothetical protein